MTFRLFQFVGALVVCVFGLTTTAGAGLITSSANLPPAGVYLGPEIHQIYGGPALEFLLSLPQHAPFANVVDRRHGGDGQPGTPADEIETFGSSLTAMMEVRQNGMSISGGPQPISASGPVMTLVKNKIGNTTGTFDTEMLQLDLTGLTPLGPFMIRESPTLPSLGKTTITDIGGGLYHIDSFFDVFTELSIDGGQTWMPSNSGSARMVLVPAPVASMLGLAGFGLLALCRRRRD